MLNPIKSFFNYLQKNANSPLGSKKEDEVSMTDMINTSEGPEGSSFEDPLTDPLAIDNEFVDSSQDDLNQIQTPPESVSIENIVFIDIEKLKAKKSDEADVIKNVTGSDINGNIKECDEKEENAESTNQEKHIVEESDIRLEDASSSTQTVTNSECLDVLNNSFLNNVNESEVEREVDIVADTSSLLEEFRSDGSDSGLGSDSLRSISAIEKNLATLTPSKSSLKRRSVDNLHEDPVKKAKRGINFGDVTVFYFTRCQGFGCVPTTGGSTLGMTAKHAYKKSFTLVEHSIEQRRLYRLKMAGNELNGSSSSSDESKSEDEISDNSFSEGDNDSYGFLQPVTARQRRALLKAAGVKKIDTVEKDECRQLRTSREVCGCTCRGYCDPDTCECSQAGIKCQVDRLKPHEFPCGCTRDGCANVNGRIEFNPARVKTHFIHTIMRLELEKRQEMPEDSSTSVIPNNSKWWSQMRQNHTQHSSTSYTSYPYNNGSSSSLDPQCQGKIPAIGSMVSQIPSTTGQESLDLHYAFRDEYNSNTPSSLSFNQEPSPASFTSPGRMTEYYTNFNYLPVQNPINNPFPNMYDSIHHPIETTTQPASSMTLYQDQLPLQLNNSVDCQYSNYSLPNESNKFHSRTDHAIDIDSGFANNYAIAMHNGNTTGNTRINYHHPETTVVHQQSRDVLNSFCTIEQNTTTSSTAIAAKNNITTIENCTDNLGSEKNGSNEILSEIIKKSIVETVTA